VCLIRIGKTIIGAAGSWRWIGETAPVNAWWLLFLFRDDFAYVRFFAAIASARHARPALAT
jgi:hypothetical protein